VLYIVDVNHKPSPSDAPLPPPAADFPAPPPNAIPFTNNGSPIPVYYNQTVVLQCMTSGVVSPVLVIRKVDHTTTAVGGGTPDHTKAAADHFCPPGEVCGDPVSQLHKIAFEVFDVNATPPMDGSPGDGGAFLSCMGEKVNTFRPVESRKWTSRAGDSPVLPSVSTPLGSSASFGSVGDYFSNGGMNSLPPSPRLDFQSHDGGRVRKKRSASSTGGIRSRGARRRPPSNDSMSPTGSHFPEMAMNPFHGAQWQVEIGETSVWTIVGVDQVRYNFYIPPVLLDNPNAPRGQSFPIPKRQITPFMGVVKWLPADRAAEVVRQGHHWQPAQPQRDQSKLLTLYGENFNRADPPRVFFGADPSPLVEVRCDQVVGCLPPDPEGHVPQGPRRPIILVRADGVVYPTMTMYP
jgi:recombining binding protein (suppressor of hairless)